MVFSGDFFLASTYGGGVWISVDEGKTWSEANSGLGDRYINGLVVDPAYSNIVYALTESAGLKKIDLSGGGWVGVASLARLSAAMPVEAWESPGPYPLHEPMSELVSLESNGQVLVQELDTSISSPVLAMMFAPGNSNVAYVGTNGSGVYSSLDGAVTWAPAGLAGWMVRDLAVDPADANHVYAAATAVSNGASTVFGSSDGGKTWNNNPLPGLVPYTLAVSPFDPDVVYAGTSNGIWKYSGGTWVQAGLAGSIVGVLQVSPYQPGLLIAGTSSGTYTEFSDGNWQSLDEQLAGFSVQSIAVSPKGPNSIYSGTSTFGIRQSPYPDK
jgi:hypothetical protein